MWKKFTLSLLVVVSLGIRAVSGDTIQLSPSDDMYTDPDHTTAHPVAELWTADWSPLSNFQRICMRFDVSGFNSEEIESATLHLYRFYGCPSGEPTVTDVYAVTSDWSEENWPENQHLPHGDTSWASYVFSANGWATIDLTSLTQAWCDTNLENLGFVIVADQSKFSKVYSKEAANSNQRPYLELTTTTGLERAVSQPEALRLVAYPNPFNGALSCQLQLTQAAHTRMDLINARGQSVANVFYGALPSGTSSISYRTEGLPSGLYFLHVKAGAVSNTQRVLLVQ